MKFKFTSGRPRCCGSILLVVAFWAGSPKVSWSQEDDNAVPPRGGQGRILILTTPSQAEAYMEGNDLGPTPVDTTFPSGRHTLTLTLNGVEVVRKRINVWPDSTTTFTKNLTEPFGSLVLKTNPTTCDCTVSVDSVEVGSTHGGPLTVNNVRAGTRIVDVSDGTHSKEYSVLVLPEKTVELLVDFTGP
jgi:hypothetical protein